MRDMQYELRKGTYYALPYSYYVLRITFYVLLHSHSLAIKVKFSRLIAE